MSTWFAVFSRHDRQHGTAARLEHIPDTTSLTRELISLHWLHIQQHSRHNDLPSFERQCTSVSVTCHPICAICLPLTNFLFHRSTFPPSESGLFQFPAPTSGTVFHQTWHLHRRWRYSDSVWRHFSNSLSFCVYQLWHSIQQCDRQTDRQTQRETCRQTCYTLRKFWIKTQ